MKLAEDSSIRGTTYRAQIPYLLLRRFFLQLHNAQPYHIFVKLHQQFALTEQLFPAGMRRHLQLKLSNYYLQFFRQVIQQRIHHKQQSELHQHGHMLT